MNEGYLSTQLLKGLNDKLYDKRKASAIELERSIRDAYVPAKIPPTIATLHSMLTSPHPHTRSGALISLAAVCIALSYSSGNASSQILNGASSSISQAVGATTTTAEGKLPNEASVDFGKELDVYLPDILHPIIASFNDIDNRVRYYACESLYNVVKVSRTSVLRYFDEIFDVLCKATSDTEASVKNGAELLDRLLREIVTENTTYIPPKTVPSSQEIVSNEGEKGVVQDESENRVPGSSSHSLKTTFNLPRFIPLLSARITTTNPHTRIFILSYISLLSSIPDLEFIAYLEGYLGGILLYIGDKDVEVSRRAAAAGDLVLAEVKNVLERGGKVRAKERNGASSSTARQDEGETLKKPDPTVADVPASTVNTTFDRSGSGLVEVSHATASTHPLMDASVDSIPDMTQLSLENEPQTENTAAYAGVILDMDMIVEILAPFMLSTDETTQAMSLRWINTFITHSKEIMLSYAPMILTAILPSLSHTNPTIQSIAKETNLNLYRLIYNAPSSIITGSPPSPSLQLAIPSYAYPYVHFDLKPALDALTLQFRNENEETRIASMEWFLMLHSKAPSLVFRHTDEKIFSALYRTLSDSSSEVVRRDLSLLTQIASYSDGEYFGKFCGKLIGLFKNDRTVVESRGSFIFRQLCAMLGPERVYATFAEILETDEDLEFASFMVENLNLVLLTTPELSSLRDKLRQWETCKEGASLFNLIYKSWCHNAVSTFSLCLLASAYSHAYTLLTTFTTAYELTLSSLVQLDKLVQLLESPIFIHLRLHLLEPDKYGDLYKCVYGLLMVLPQSSAFATLRNRVGCVTSMVMLYGNGMPFGAGNSRHGMSGGNTASTGNSSSSKGMNWASMLSQFMQMQQRHEQYRRTGTVVDQDIKQEKPEKKAKESVVKPASSSTKKRSVVRK